MIHTATLAAEVWESRDPLKSVGLICPDCGKAWASIEGVAWPCSCGAIFMVSVARMGYQEPRADASAHNREQRP